MSEGKEISLGVKVEEEVAKKFHIEVINQHGQAHGNMGKCIKEAIKEWTEKSKRKRLEKEKAT